MKTEDLIGALVQDGATSRASLTTGVAVALLTGGAVAVVLFAQVLGVRPDIGAALQTWRFLLKLVVVLACFVVALWACVHLARPNASWRRVIAGLAVVPALLGAAIGYELLDLPPDQWVARAIGSNSRICLVAVPLLAIAPLVALLAALRVGAPGSPAAAGAAAGLLAGALAALLYATHCIDDSPLFVALWYPPAIAAVALIGAIAGHRVLRW